MPDRNGNPTLEEVLGFLGPDAAYALSTGADTGPRSQPPAELSPSAPVAAPAPQVAPGGGFRERLGLALYDQPLRYYPHPGRGRGFQNFLGSAIEGAAGSLGTGTARAVSRRDELNARLTALQGEKNKAALKASEAASALATYRHKKRIDAEFATPKTQPKAPPSPEDRGRANAAAIVARNKDLRSAGQPVPGASRRLAAKPAAARIGPTIPSLLSLSRDLKARAANAGRDYHTAARDSLGGLAAQIDRFHAQLREAQSQAEVEKIETPPSMSESVKRDLARAVRVRLGQLGNGQ